MKKSLILIACSMLMLACKDEQSGTEVKAVEVSFKREANLQLFKTENDSIFKELEIEIADDDYQRETGLMYRKSMRDTQGMLFVFPEADYRSFYMRNTEFPIDIIFLGADKKIINIQKNAKPLDESSLPSTAPAQYVLEINSGLSDEWNIEAGDSISYQ